MRQLCIKHGLFYMNIFTVMQGIKTLENSKNALHCLVVDEQNTSNAVEH